ncbi:MAG: nucleoside deaminase, partial [Anaerolineae bacterium]
MCEALIEARKAFLSGEVPVGAVLVFEEKIIARAHNLVELHKDATQHAELLCLKKAFALQGDWRLQEMSMYCTLEPCSMCAGAMISSRLKELVWAAPDLRQGAHGSWVNLLDTPHPIHNIRVHSGILKEEAGALMTQFFRNRRKERKRYIPDPVERHPKANR